MARYLGRDGTIHTWWWRVFEKWEKERNDMDEVLRGVGKHVARPLWDEKFA